MKSVPHLLLQPGIIPGADYREAANMVSNMCHFWSEISNESVW
jgi:hypothetical protein